MSHYWKKCPHCWRTIESGYGYGWMRLGSPKKQCRFCFKPYTDRSIVDWEKASVFKKIQYFFANGRFFLCFLPYALACCFLGMRVAWGDWLVCLACSPVLLILLALCALYVRHQVKEYLDIYEEDDAHRYDKYKNGMF